MPVYTINIPQPGDNPSQSQDQILQNFQTLNTAFSVNHVAFNNADQGKHNKISIPVNGGAASTFLVTEMGMQNRSAAPTSRPDIWLSRGTDAAYPMTGYQNGGTTVNNGWTYLPSGLKMAWGVSTCVNAAVLTVVYAAQLTNFPGFTTFWSCPQTTRIRVAPPAQSGAFVMVQDNFSATQFSAFSSDPASTGNVEFAWTVIGL